MSTNCPNNTPPQPSSGFIEPICTPPPPSFQSATCTPLEFPSSTAPPPFCDIEIPCTSLECILANFPLFLTFLVTFPYRFMFCYAYSAILNFDIITLFIVNLINNAVNYYMLPLIYFAYGFFDGLADDFQLPTQPLCIACPVNIILPQLYNALGDFFYIIGFIIGFLTSLLLLFYNFIIYFLCFIANFTFTIGICFAIGFSVAGVNIDITLNPEYSFQPFSFLQGLLGALNINCQCALGTCPAFSLVFCLSYGVSCPSGTTCGTGLVNPECSFLPSLRCG